MDTLDSEVVINDEENSCRFEYPMKEGYTHKHTCDLNG